MFKKLFTLFTELTDECTQTARDWSTERAQVRDSFSSGVSFKNNLLVIRDASGRVLV